MIREATSDDIAAVAEIVISASEHMHYDEFSKHGIYPDATSVVEFLFRAKNAPGVGLFVVEVDGEVIGACCVALSPLLLNKNVIASTELFWHMRVDLYQSIKGKKWFVRLLDHMTAWSKEHGASWFIGITRPGVSGKLLERRGMLHTENNYEGAL